MRRKSLLLTAVVACVAAAVVPVVANARTAKVSSIGSRLSTLSGKVAGLSKVVGGLVIDDKGLKARLSTVEDATRTNGAAIADAQKAVAAALPRTIDVQYFVEGGTVAKGGKVAWTGSPGTAAYRVDPNNGLYLVDFGQDVSKRTVLGLNAASATNSFGGVYKAFNCGRSAADLSACQAAASGTAVKPNQNYALVGVNEGGGNGPGTEAARFSLAEIAGA